jgi:hypothetical protein
MGAGASSGIPSEEEVGTELQRREMVAIATNCPLNSSEQLYFAAYYGNLPKVKNLIQQGDARLDWSHPMLDGRTALHIAAIAGNLEIVEYLCQKGAEVSRCDGEGKTPDMWAEEAGEQKIADLIRRFRKEKNVPGKARKAKAAQSPFERYEQERGPAHITTKAFRSNVADVEGSTGLWTGGKSL